MSQGEQASQDPSQNAPKYEVDSSEAFASYANFLRVSGGPEELIIDFGLNPHPQGNSPEPIKVSQRVVLNFYNAKRLLQLLHMTVQQHEKAFGELETDFRNRLLQQPGDGSGPTSG